MLADLSQAIIALTVVVSKTDPTNLQWVSKSTSIFSSFHDVINLSMIESKFKGMVNTLTFHPISTHRYADQGSGDIL